LISSDLKIGQPRYPGASPTGEPILRGRSRGRSKASWPRERNEGPV
jgi:hypothetical protein